MACEWFRWHSKIYGHHMSSQPLPLGLDPLVNPQPCMAAQTTTKLPTQTDFPHRRSL